MSAIVSEAIPALRTGGLLRIMVSTRGSKSYSLQMLEEFTQEWKTSYPDLPIIDRHTFDIPHLDTEALDAGRINPSKHTPEMAEAFALAKTLTEEMLNCQHLVIASPMYNWGPPSSLKAWADRVINSITFYGNPKLLAGLPITFIITSGGPYSEDAGVPHRAVHDHFRPMLREWFTQMGSSEEDFVFVNCDPTGPVEFGAVSRDDPSSGFSRGRAKLPLAARRLKA